jgi:hypothetical protein
LVLSSSLPFSSGLGLGLLFFSLCGGAFFFFELVEQKSSWIVAKSGLVLDKGSLLMP